MRKRKSIKYCYSLYVLLLSIVQYRYIVVIKSCLTAYRGSSKSTRFTHIRKIPIPFSSGRSFLKVTRHNIETKVKHYRRSWIWRAW